MHCQVERFKDYSVYKHYYCMFSVHFKSFFFKCEAQQSNDLLDIRRCGMIAIDPTTIQAVGS